MKLARRLSRCYRVKVWTNRVLAFVDTRRTAQVYCRCRLALGVYYTLRAMR